MLVIDHERRLGDKPSRSAGAINVGNKVTFWEAVADAKVVRRSLKVAIVVGTILAIINNWDRLVPFRLGTVEWIKIAMTYCVPYCVSTYSAASTLMAQDS